MSGAIVASHALSRCVLQLQAPGLDAGFDDAARGWLAFGLIAFVVITYVLGLVAQSRVESTEDFLVAGRRLGLGLATATIMATWFGAGTMLTAADAVRAEGLRKIALEPLGAGLCLLITGLVLAKPLWEMKLLTLADFFGVRFGKRAELMCAVLTVPTYLGWIAVQFVALAGVLEVFFAIPWVHGVWLVAAVGTGYTLMGGMWSVTLTDALQLSILSIGLVVLGVATMMSLGDGSLVHGVELLQHGVPAERWIVIPHDRVVDLFGWVNVLAIAALGNIPSQDLTQRVFAARSSVVAQRACILAAVLYIGLGLIPVMMGLASNLVLPEFEGEGVVPAMAATVLDWRIALVFVLALTAAVLSSIDSGLLAPASVLSHNLIAPAVAHRFEELSVSRACVFLVALCSMGVAYVGESAYALLEDSYSVTLAALFVPLFLGVLRPPKSERPALVSMTVGTSLWVLHFALDWDAFLQPVLRDKFAIELPPDLPIVAVCAALYLLFDRAPADGVAGAGADSVGTGSLSKGGMP